MNDLTLRYFSEYFFSYLKLISR